MKLVIRWVMLWMCCKHTKMTKERGEDVRVCQRNGFNHCKPENCPLLEE